MAGKTQNPAVATPCGFDPRHRHQIETVIRIQSPFLFVYLKKPEKPGVSGLFRLFTYDQPGNNASRSIWFVVFFPLVGLMRRVAIV